MNHLELIIHLISVQLKIKKVIIHKLKIDTENKVIALNLQIDENICTMYEYFDIFLGRMMMCRKAAELLGVKFKLTANGSKVL